MPIAAKKILFDNFLTNIFLAVFNKNTCAQVATNRLIISANFYQIFANFLSKI